MYRAIPWTHNEEDHLRLLISTTPQEAYKSYLRTFGNTRSYESIRKKLKRLREDKTDALVEQVKAEMPPDLFEKPEDQAFSLLDPMLCKLQAETWINSIISLSKGRKRNVELASLGNRESLVLFVSDTHFGKYVSDPLFNMEVAKNRLLSLPDKILEAPDETFDTLTLIFGGDLVEGEDIFAHQNAIVEAPLISQFKEATTVLWQLILDLKATFNVPVQIYTVPGNHGRHSKTAHPSSNWDNAVHCALDMLVAQHNDPKIQMNLNLKEMYVAKISGKNYLLYHEGTKHLGTPSMREKLAGWIIDKNIEGIIHGHWHNPAFDTYIGRLRISNGSLCGGKGDELPERMARPDPPAQVAFKVYPHKRPDSFYIFSW